MGTNAELIKEWEEKVFRNAKKKGIKKSANTIDLIGIIGVVSDCHVVTIFLLEIKELARVEKLRISVYIHISFLTALRKGIHMKP
ncbi:hypothetical protein AB8U03_13255 [Clostridium sp. Mt-5]|uniref:Uncharacterized protein n=1 Tax=Clostridium moutaii TaxID=3240932 RepID=A0ABV4BRK4_9CLOT